MLLLTADLGGGPWLEEAGGLEEVWGQEDLVVASKVRQPLGQTRPHGQTRSLIDPLCRWLWPRRAKFSLKNFAF